MRMIILIFTTCFLNFDTMGQKKIFKFKPGESKDLCVLIKTLISGPTQCTAH